MKNLSKKSKIIISIIVIVLGLAAIITPIAVIFSQDKPQQTVTYVYNIDNTDDYVFTVDEGSKVSDLRPTAIPGYCFLGFFADELFSNEIDPNTIIENDLTIYLNYSPISYSFVSIPDGLTIMHDSEEISTSDNFSYGDELTISYDIQEGWGVNFNAPSLELISDNSTEILYSATYRIVGSGQNNQVEEELSITFERYEIEYSIKIYADGIDENDVNVILVEEDEQTSEVNYLHFGDLFVVSVNNEESNVIINLDVVGAVDTGETNQDQRLFRAFSDVTIYIDVIYVEDDGFLLYEAVENGYLVVGFSGDSIEELIIPTFHNGESIIGIADGAFESDSTIVSVIIPDRIRTIGERAFNECSSLESVTIGRDVTTIGDSAFANCTNMNTLYFNATNCTVSASADSHSNYVFYDCGHDGDGVAVTFGDSVRTIPAHLFNSYYQDVYSSSWGYSLGDLEDSNNEINVPHSSLERLVTHSMKITSLTLGENITSIGDYAFMRCKWITAVDFPEGLQTIGEGAFAWTSINSVDTNASTIEEHAFYECPSLSIVTLNSSNLDIGSVAFADTDKMTLTISSDADFYENLSVSNFWYNVNFSTINVAESIIEEKGIDLVIGIYYTYELENGMYVFTRKSDSELETLILPSGITEIKDRMFSFNIDKPGTETLPSRSVIIPEGVVRIGNQVFYMVDELENVTLPSTLQTMGDYTFASCDNLTSVVLPSSLQSIGKYAFSNCDNLTSVTINSNVTLGENAFHNKNSADYLTLTINNEDFYAKLTSLSLLLAISKTINVPESIVDSKGIDSILSTYYTYELDNGMYIFTKITGDSTTITVPDDLSEVQDYIFYNNQNLESIIIPEGIEVIGSYAFANCTNLKSVTLPSTLKTIEDYAFYNCTSLESIELPESVTSIGSYAFYSCTNLQSITIPQNITILNSHIFSHCSSLESIVIPENVTIIGASAFAYCENLQSVTIPEGVERIEDYAFRGCTSLVSLNLPSTLQRLGQWSLADCSSLSSLVINSSEMTYGNAVLVYCSDQLVITINNEEFYNNIDSNSYSNMLRYGNKIYIPESFVSADDINSYLTDNYSYEIQDSMYVFTKLPVEEAVTDPISNGDNETNSNPLDVDGGSSSPDLFPDSGFVGEGTDIA